MGDLPNVIVGQVWEDFEPIYPWIGGPNNERPPCHRRRLKVVELTTQTERVWSRKSQVYERVQRRFAKLQITRLTDGTETETGRTVTVRIDRMLPKKGGYRLVEEAF